MEKLDFKEEFEYLYKASTKRFSMVTVPPLRYLMTDGHGDPETSSDFQTATEALYIASTTLKSFSKKEFGKDYVLPPLEALCWADDASAIEKSQKDSWAWSAIILVPDWIDKVMISDAIETAKQQRANSKLDELRLDVLREGKCVQIMCIGPYRDEEPVLSKLHREYIPQHGLAFKGKHHEIYLNDPRKTPPKKLRTMLRQPVGKIS